MVPDGDHDRLGGRGKAPAEFALGDVCELREGGEAGGIVRCRGQDLTGDEIRGHLQAGKQATRLGLIWDGRVAFVLDEALVVRRLHFLDVVRESLRDTAALPGSAVRRRVCPDDRGAGAAAAAPAGIVRRRGVTLSAGFGAQDRLEAGRFATSEPGGSEERNG